MISLKRLVLENLAAMLLTIVFLSWLFGIFDYKPFKNVEPTVTETLTSYLITFDFEVPNDDCEFRGLGVFNTRFGVLDEATWSYTTPEQGDRPEGAHFFGVEVDKTGSLTDTLLFMADHTCPAGEGNETKSRVFYEINLNEK